MNRYLSLFFASLLGLLMLAACVPASLTESDEATRQMPEPVLLGLEDVPMDALMVITAYVERMRGVPAGQIEEARFEPGIAEAIEQPDFRFSGFRLAALNLFRYDVSTIDPYQIDLGASLLFMDPLGRRTVVALYTTYGEKEGRLLVSRGAVETIYPKVPAVELYLLRTKDMPNPIPVNHSEFYQLVLEKALSPAERAANFGRPQPYTVVAFGMDRLDPKAKLELRISDDPDGVKGYAGGMQEYNYVGWHAATLSGIFTLNRQQPMFAKVVYTPGTSTSLFKRQPRLAGRFDLRQTTRRVITTATRQPSKPQQPTGRSLVRSIQQELNALGYKAGPADGLAGKKTRQAIRAFQKQAGVRVDGQPSVELLELLRQVRGR
ncbi:MAG TPA: peptidoglycan-binding protein [Sedimenticola thiotaurini]|uniref:Peptidoglycan-binding protein n=1 Tax=Sedimenticola thiotaurini TaxID=1543721 RepID=A0A831W4D3_9GAMM|nr:peptidoglycan-binding protein [Sedimenticola thiotaurini]